MKVSASIELVWQLACREAIAGRQESIAPEHFCMALLKLAELSSEQFARMSPNGDRIAGELTRDAEAIRNTLEGGGLSSRQARRQLRKAVGKGEVAYDGGQMHRSDSSRVLFDDAARLADESGSATLTPEHLFSALTAKPTRLIGEIVLVDGKGLPVAGQQPGLLSEWGTDLTALAKRGELGGAYGRAAEAKAILKALQAPRRIGVFLVSEGELQAREAMHSLARAAADTRSATGVKRWRVVDLTMKSAPTTPECSTVAVLQQLFADAAHIEDLVLRVPDIRDMNDGKEMLTLLKTGSASTRPAWICAIDEAVYRQRIQQDAYWRSAATAILLQQDIGQGIPDEL